MTESHGSAPHTGPDLGPGGPASAPPGDPVVLLDRVGASWTWLLGSAVATLIPGILILVWPEETLHVLAVLLGLYLLVIGVFRFVSVFGHREQGNRFATLLISVLYVLAGVLCLRHPMQTIAALSLILGIVWLVSGVLTAYTALAAKDLPHRGFVLCGAAIGIIAGIVVLALPTESARALTRLLGLWMVLIGLVELVIAFAWRAALRRAVALTPRDPASPY
ncbi:HdeD family acid-resistance protein [Streptomyces sp. NPDC021080]|uniref:HdeD family acid-resistance protein n=1 Tax=Streptomyces sp. NPDC021080 TaxID=3365110 RepID=UPI0037B3CBFC